MAQISVLYVDDDVHLLDVCKIYLEQAGSFRIDTAVSAKDAQVKLASGQYDAIISDYEMPKTNGIEFLKIVRKKFGDIPFIIFTGRGREEIVIEAINSGADYYLQKGGDPEAQFTELAHKIRQAVKSRNVDISLRNSEEKFREIFNSVNDAIQIHEVDEQGLPGKFIEVNDVACRMLQYTRSELLKKSPLDFSTGYHNRPLEDIGDAIRTLGHAVFETVHIRKDGTFVPVEISAHVSSLMGRNMVVSVIRDITERKQQDQAIRAGMNLGIVLQKVNSVKDALEVCLASAIEATELDSGAIYLIDSKTGVWDLKASRNLGEEFVASISHYPAESIPAKMMTDGKNEYYPGGPDLIASTLRNAEGLACLAAIPIRREDSVIACLTLYSHKTGEIPENTRVVLETIANQVGIAIDRSRAEETLVKSHEELHAAYEQLTANEEELRQNYEQITVNEEELRQNYDELEKGHRKLAKSEERFRLLFDHMDEGLALHTLVFGENRQPADYRILAVNNSFERLLGINRNSVIGKTSRDAYGTGEPPYFDIYTRVAISGKPESFETYFPPLQKHFHISVYSPGKNHFATIFSDISERKRAEDAFRKKNTDLEAAYEELTSNEEELRQSYDELAASQQELRKSEARYRRIVETATEGIWEMDADLRTTFVNRQLAEFLGYPKEEMIGMPIYSFMPEEDLADHRQKIEERKNGKSGSYERRFLHKNGTVLWALVSATALLDENGIFAGSFAMVTDINDRRKAEEVIRTSEEKYRSIVETSTEGIWVMDAEFRISFVNSRMREILGYSDDEMMGRRITDFVLPEEIEACKQQFEKRRAGISGQFERHYVCKDGKVVILLGSATPVTGTDGTFQGSFAMFSDMTELKRAEEAEREIGLIYKSLIQNSSDMIRILNREGLITYTSPSTFSVVGYRPEELIGKDPMEYIHPDDLASVKEALHAVYERNNPATPTEFRIRNKNGDYVDVESVAVNLSGVRGIDGIVTTTRPITERKQASKRLQENQVLLEDAMDLASMAHWEYDVVSGKFTFNDRFYVLYGTTAEREGGYEMLPEVYAREFVHPDDAHMVEEEIRKALSTQDPGYRFELEHRIFRRDGSIRTIIVRYSVEMDAEGRVTKTHGVNQDITERKRAEDAIRQANRQLSLMTSITRHDILNNVTALNSYLALCRKKEILPEVQSLIGKMESVTATIGQQIEFTRLYKDLGTHAPKWQDTDDILAHMNYPPSLILRRNGTGIEIFADSLLEKVFYNLLDNTIRHSGGATQVSISYEAGTDGMVLVWEDNGKGIARDEKEEIFERGFGANTGLGLFLAREILGITGITIRETGEPGNGARFEMMVPNGAYRMNPDTS